MGSKYTNKTVSGYNAAPPPDDGSKVPANLASWAGVKSKLNDPILVLVQAINTALLAALDFTSRLATASDTATAADHMRTIETAAVGATETLPDAATVGAGFTVNYKNTGVGVLSIVLQTAGNTLEGTANGTTTIPAGGWLQFKVNTAATGYYIMTPVATVISPASAAGNAVRADQIQNQSLTAVTTSGTSAAYIAQPSPLLTVLLANLRLRLKFDKTAGGTQTSGALTIGRSYTINTFVTGDDFTNVGGTNVSGNVFVATGATPTTWTHSSTLTGGVQTLGALVIGRQYTITTFVAGDDFTNVGAASNATGVTFTATGTTPTTWTNASTLTLNAQTLGLLTIGVTYRIASFVAGDDFANVGAASNASGQVFVATGTTPTTWTNASVLVEAQLITLSTAITQTAGLLTSGTLIVGRQYFVVNIVTGDDFTNVGGVNTSGTTFTATGTTPTTWTGGSTLQLGLQVLGALTVGQTYKIASFVAGDDFTNVGAASNATGVVFVATGTTPTVWTNKSALSGGTNLLTSGKRYVVSNYVAGDDFTNIGGTNTTGAVFTTTGTTPTSWVAGSALSLLDPHTLKQYDSTGAKAFCSASNIVANMLTDIEWDGADYVVRDPLPTNGNLIAFTDITASNAAWVPNPATRRIVVELIGGGGPGGAGSNSNAGGGGGGEGSRVTAETASVAGSYAVTIGASAGATIFGALATAAAGGTGVAASTTTPGVGGSGGGEKGSHSASAAAGVPSGGNGAGYGGGVGGTEGGALAGADGTAGTANTGGGGGGGGGGSAGGAAGAGGTGRARVWEYS